MKRILLALLSLFFSLSCHAEILAAIEIGSVGVKAIAVDYGGTDKEGQRTYKIIFREEIKADAIEGASNRLLSDKKIADVANAVKVLFEKLRKLDPQYFTMVGSTSFDNYDNRTALENAIFDKVNKRVVFITGDEEIFYALKASVRSSFLPRSILIDIGGGNTKVGYASPMSASGFESTRFEYGTRSLADKAIKMGGDYQEALKQIIQAEVIPVVRDAIRKQPGLANVNRRIYIEGGSSWAAASYAQPENVEKQFNYITLKDIDAVIRRFDRNELTVNVTSEGAQKTFSKILDTYTTAQYQAGFAILRTLLSEMNASQRRIVFNRDGGWVLGYLMTSYIAQKGIEE